MTLKHEDFFHLAVKLHTGDSLRNGKSIIIIPTGTNWKPMGIRHCTEPLEGDMNATP